MVAATGSAAESSTGSATGSSNAGSIAVGVELMLGDDATATGAGPWPDIGTGRELTRVAIRNWALPK